MDKIPSAVALIPDGNRRWANKHKMSFAEGYSIGVNKFIDFAEWCKGYGVKNITVWAFSTENFKRPSAERKVLFSIYEKVANDENIISRLHKNKTRFEVVGNISLLPSRLQAALHNVEQETSQYKDRVINMLIAYGGRDDLLHAAKELAMNFAQKKIREINEAVFRRFMFSARIPDPDLVIRTSGEQRLSGFMPWQTGYSELYFSRKLWPDFTRRDLSLAIKEYSRRQRRFGR